MLSIRLPERGLLFRIANYLLAATVIGTALAAVTGISVLSDGLVYLDVPHTETTRDAFALFSAVDSTGRLVGKAPRTSFLVNAAGRLYDAQGATAFATCSAGPVWISGMRPTASPGLPPTCSGWTTDKVLLPAQVTPIVALDQVTFLSGDLVVSDISRSAIVLQSVYNYAPIFLLFILFLSMAVVGVIRFLASSANLTVVIFALMLGSAAFFTYIDHPKLGISGAEFAIVLIVCSVLVAATTIGVAEPIVKLMKARFPSFDAMDDTPLFCWMNAPVYAAIAIVAAVAATFGLLSTWQLLFVGLKASVSAVAPNWLSPIIDAIVQWTIW